MKIKLNILFVAMYLGILLPVTAQWQQTNFPINKSIQDIVILNNYIFAATNGDGVYMSQDNGLNWNQINNGLSNLNIWALMVKDGFLYLTSSGGSFKKSINGVEWSSINSGLPNNGFSSSGFASINNYLFIGTSTNGVFRSENNGTSWIPTNNGISNLSISSITQSNDKIYIASSDGKVFYSNDFGNNWIPITGGFPNEQIRPIAVNGQDIFIVFDGSGVIMISNNHGISWYEGPSSQNVESFLKINEINFAAAKGGGIFKSLNNGLSWTTENEGLPTLEFLSLANNETFLFAGTHNEGLFRRPLSDFGISHSMCSICDTKAWNTPFGDCASGHTNNDLVEWPSSNIEVEQSAGYLPDNLRNNPNINPNDAAPRLIFNANCNVSSGLSYVDVIQNGIGVQIVTRTWEVAIFNNDDNSIRTSEYIQTIRVINNNCEVPTLQASNIIISNLTSKQMRISWTNGDGSRRIVKINTTNNFTSPVNGTSPSANSLYTGKGEQTIYNGSSNNVTVTGLSENTIYWVRVFEANCSGTNSYYSSTTASFNPINRTTPANQISGNITVSGNLDFGAVPTNSFNDKALILYNNTSSPIKITSITYSLTGNIFRNGFQQNGNAILPGKTLPISVLFTPPESNIYNATVTVNTNLPGVSTTFTVRGSGVNIQSNWLGVYNELENNPELRKRQTLYEFFFSTQAAEPLKICADGSKSTVFVFTNNNPSLNTKDVVFRIKSAQNSGNSDFTGRFLNTDYIYNNSDPKTFEVRFSHPKYLNTSGLFRTDVIEVINNNTGSIIHEIPIQVYRAPVVLVHGLWGNWTNLLSLDNHLRKSGKYNPTLIRLWDYENTNAVSFSDNRNEIKNALNSIFERLRFEKYSSGRVDIVAHSMGGILSRLYLQNDICLNGQTNDCYRNDINKLITLNTPHSGTQAANYLLNQWNNCAVYSSFFLKKFKKPINKGAVADLRCNSLAIRSNVNGINLNNNIVPIHTIVTTAFHNKLYELGEDESLLVNAISLCRPFDNREIFLNKLFDNRASDFIVPDISQRGGLQDYSLFFDLLHTKSHRDQSVQNRVLLLLEENPVTSTFFDENRNGFNPPVINPTLQIDSPDDRDKSGTRSNLFVEILNPQDNATFNVGETIHIKLNTTSQSENLTLFISNGYSGSKFVDLGNSTTYSINLDSDLTGTVNISALITDSQGNFGIDSVTINVLPIVPFDSLSFINDEINIPIHQTFSLSVAGFLNNEIFEMGRFPEVQYLVDNPSIVKINAPGLFEALNLGTTFIKASFQGFEAYIKLNVYDGFDWIYASNCSLPTTQSSAISFSFVSTQQFTINWSNGNGSRRVVKINTTNQFTPPANGTDPIANPVYSGSGEQVIYNGNGNSVTVTGLKPNTVYWVRVYEANCEGVYSLYNTTLSTQNPNSQQTVLVPPYIQSFSASTVTSQPGGGTQRQVFYHNTNVYGVNAPVIVTADGSNNTVFTLKASFITGMGFRIINKQGKIVTNGDIATDPVRYGILGVKQVLSHNTLEMTYTHPQFIDEAVLPLRIQLLYYNGLLGLTIPLELVAASPLPVEIINLTAYHDDKNNQNEISWTTQSERNNDYFVLERSFEDELFIPIGIVKGSGNSVSPINYYFHDKDIYQNGIYTYRLQQVDYDGDNFYSWPVSVILSKGNIIKTGLYPNPSSGLINLFVEAHEGAKVNIDIFNLMGQLVKNYLLPEITSENKITSQIEAGSLIKGSYIVIFTIDGERYNYKLIVIE